MKKSKILMLSLFMPISLLFSISNFLSLGNTGYTVARPEVIKAEIQHIPQFSGEKLPQWIEEYVIGVVSSEMPIYFNKEALKAQAVASRTYAYRAYCNNKAVSFSEIGQVYKDKNALANKWGNNYEKYYTMIKSVVEETENEIMVYNNEPILAVFSSASGGMTESCKNVWGSDLPYLESVSSEQDKNAPVFYDEKTFSLSEIKNIFNVDSINTSNTYIEQRSAAGYVQSAVIGGKTLDGDKIRCVLGLKSSNFTLDIKSDSVIINTRGYGHGVGMSQYGAEFMAQNGYNYKEILTHYYSGVDIIKVGRD